MENLNNLIRVDWSNQRVLTYKQVADALNCSVDQLRSLYKTHKEQFKEGVHYFNIEGAALKALKKDMSNRYVDTPAVRTFAKGAKCLKLWTYQGVACLSKLIDTDEAWRLFKALEYKYFGIETAEEKKTSVEEVAPADISAAVIADLQQQFAALDEKVTGLENVFSQWLEEIQNQLTPADKADKLVAFAEKIRNDEVRDKMLMQAANLILGKKLF